MKKKKRKTETLSMQNAGNASLSPFPPRQRQGPTAVVVVASAPSRSVVVVVCPSPWHFVSLISFPLHPATSWSQQRRRVPGRTHRPGLPGLHRRCPLVTVVVVPWSPLLTSAPLSLVLVLSCGFVGMAPLPQQLATVGCWWPLSLSLPHRPFLSLPVCPCHRPSLS